MHTTNYCLLLQEPRQKHVAGYDVAQWSEVRANVASTPPQIAKFLPKISHQEIASLSKENTIEKSTVYI